MSKSMTLLGRLSSTFMAAVVALAFPIGGVHAQENLIKNGNFDDGFANWTATVVSGGSNTLTISSASNCAPFHTTNAATWDVFGNRRALLDQTVIIPGNSTASLKFKVWGQFDPTTMKVKAITSGGFETTLDTFVVPKMIQSVSTTPFTCTGASFDQKTYDMTAYTGQSVTIRFEATAPGFNGTFALVDDVELTATGGGGGVPTPTPPDGGKRPTATGLFCNRSGPNLETAKCSATVGDAGDPPRVTPTGAVNFIATDGFFPAVASCQLQQTQFSPGIGACEAQFSVPAGFPIGQRFPIDALYEGSDVFESSSTSHFLIQPGCVSTDPQKPCPNSIGLSFGEFPKIKKEKVTLTIGCGSKSSNPNVAVGGVCQTTVLANVDIRQVLDKFTQSEWSALAAFITEKAAKGDAFMRVALELSRLNPSDFSRLKANSAALDALARDIANNKLKKPAKGGKPLDPYLAIGTSAFTARAKVKASLTTAKVQSTIKAERQKDIKIRLGGRISKIATVFRKASLLLPVSFNVTVKQKNRKGTAKLSQTIEVAP